MTANDLVNELAMLADTVRCVGDIRTTDSDVEVKKRDALLAVLGVMLRATQELQTMHAGDG